MPRRRRYGRKPNEGLNECELRTNVIPAMELGWSLAPRQAPD